MNNQVLCFPFFLTFSIFLLLAGIGETVTSAFAIYYSGGTFIGGIYVGVIAMLTALRGFSLSKDEWYFMDLFLLLVAFTTSMVAIYLVTKGYEEVKDLKACSVYTSTLSNSCASATAANFACYGDSDYFLDAKKCAMSYYDAHGADAKECSCVVSDSNDCYSYVNIESCRRLEHYLPLTMEWCLIFAVCIFLVIGFMILPAVSSYFCYDFCSGNLKKYRIDPVEEAESRQSLIQNLVGPSPPNTPASPLHTPLVVAVPAEVDEESTIASPYTLEETVVPAFNPTFNPTHVNRSASSSRQHSRETTQSKPPITSKKTSSRQNSRDHSRDTSHPHKT
jgi:hypothetical protein